MIITVLVTVWSFICISVAQFWLDGGWFFLTIPAIFIVNYFFVRYFLEKFVFRKVKLIYKLIYDSKMHKHASEGQVESLEDVNTRVLEWAESTRKEIATLKSLEEYRKNYVGNISHELKTPIFSIQAYLHTLLEGGIYDGQINMEYLKRAADNTERLQNIVEDLDTITRLESGSVQMDLKRIDLKALVLDIFQDLTSMAKSRQISLQLKDGASETYYVMADKDALRQVFTNLLVNSIKYGKDGGVTKVSFYDMEQLVLVEVSDNGIGIEERHVKHVFDRFYRVDSSRSRKQGGSGLGLAIVKHLIEAHNQTINIRSTFDVGSTFGFTLSKAGR
jgi:two-component system phosphate regulon sensor histidine kinase PhoR